MCIQLPHNTPTINKIQGNENIIKKKIYICVCVCTNIPLITHFRAKLIAIG